MQLLPMGSSKVSFLTSLRASATTVSIATYKTTHLPAENSEVNLFKVSWTPQCFLKEIKNPLSCSQEIKEKPQKKPPNPPPPTMGMFWTCLYDLGTNISFPFSLPLPPILIKHFASSLRADFCDFSQFVKERVYKRESRLLSPIPWRFLRILLLSNQSTNGMKP